MTRPYSNGLRERVVSAVEAGHSRRVVAERFGVAVSWVVKSSQRYRATGSVATGKIGGHRRRVLEAYRGLIEELIKQTPHMTLHRFKVILAAHDVAVSHNATWQFLHRERLSFRNTVRP